MQIPNNNNQAYGQYGQPQQYQYPYQIQQNQQYPIPQGYQQVQQPVYVKPIPPSRKPAPFSFEPGSNKELDEALNSIDFMYNDMFDTIDNKKLKEEQEFDNSKEYCIGIPVTPIMPSNNTQQYQNPYGQIPPFQIQMASDQQKWNQYAKDSNGFY